MRFPLLILSLFVLHFGKAQLKFGLNAFYSPGTVQTDYEPVRFPEETQPIKWGHGFQGGLTVSYDIKSWIGLELDLQYDLMNYYEAYRIDQFDTIGITVPLPPDISVPFLWWNDEQWIRFERISVPFFVDLAWRRYRLKLGAAYSFLTRVGARSQLYSFVDNETTTTPFDWADGFNRHIRHDLALSCGLAVRVYRGFYLEMRYNHGILNIERDFWSWKSWTRRFSFGANFEIIEHHSEKKVEESGYKKR